LYSEKLYGCLLKRCGHKETAEDLLSRTFIKLVEAAPKLEWKNVSIAAWLFRTASNGLIDHWRSSAFQKEEELDLEAWNPPGDDDPAWNAELSLESDKLRKALQRLSPRDQEILNMKFFGEYDTAEIAATLEISPNHVAVLTYRALGRLRQMFLSIA
jgi:RNA polymerase sigma-70 factor (ECF subfamily)